MKDFIKEQLKDSARVKLRVAEELSDHILAASHLVTETFRKGGKVLIAGNGGSAADAQHIAAEFVGTLDVRRKRRALPAMALTTNTSAITALGNDYGYDLIFARKIEAFADPKKDVFIAISTSGNSANILEAIKVAKAKGLPVIGFMGKGGGQMKDLVDCALIVPSNDTQRIQEAHIAIGHVLCDIVERMLFDETTHIA